jgi:hypothetical protein
LNGFESVESVADCESPDLLVPLDGLVGKRNSDRDTIFGPEVPRNVALSSRVFDQINMARTYGDFLTSRNFNFSFTAERNYKLAPWPDMPFVRVVWRPAAELHAGGFEHFARVAVQFHLDFFGVTEAIGTRVNAGHRDGFTRLRNDYIRIGVRHPEQAK